MPPVGSFAYASLWIMRKHVYLGVKRGDLGKVRFHLKFPWLIAHCAQGKCGSFQANYKFRNLDEWATAQIWMDFASIITCENRLISYLVKTQIKSRPQFSYPPIHSLECWQRGVWVTCWQRGVWLTWHASFESEQERERERRSITCNCGLFGTVFQSGCLI